MPETDGIDIHEAPTKRTDSTPVYFRVCADLRHRYIYIPKEEGYS